MTRSPLFTHQFTINAGAFTNLGEGNSLLQKSERFDLNIGFYSFDPRSLISEQTVFVHHRVNDTVHCLFTLPSTGKQKVRS